MSGCAWDSRREYQAGLGTLEFAKTQPTHVSELKTSNYEKIVKLLPLAKSL